MHIFKLSMIKGCKFASPVVSDGVLKEIHIFVIVSTLSVH